MHKLKKLSFLILTFCTLVIYAQDQEVRPGIVEHRKDISDSVKVFYYFDSAEQIISPRYTAIDTTLNNFHHYHPLLGNGRKYAWLGNTGLIYADMFWDPAISINSYYGISAYDLYRLTPSNIPYYKLNAPFTTLAYTIGSNREQLFNGRHYQQVHRNLGLGINFNLIKSNGAYIRQKSDNASVAFQTNYKTRNQRYGITGSFINNRFIHQENGGIADAPLFEENLEPTRDRISVKLNNAENRWRESNVNFRQYLNFRIPFVKKESSDSIKSKKPATLMHSFNYQRLAMVYSDKSPGSGFYPDIFIDSSQTYDSLVIHTVLSDIRCIIPLIENDKIKFNIAAGAGYEFMHYRMHTINKKYTQVMPLLKSGLSIGNSMDVSADYQIVKGSYRNNDQILSLAGIYRFGKNHPLAMEASVKKSLITPPLFFHLFESNHFKWDNTFDKQNISDLQLNVSWKKIKAGIKFNTINGFAYLDSLAHPAWFGEKFNIIAPYAESRLKLGNLTLDYSLMYQHISKDEALKLPSLLANATISYEGSLFKGAIYAMTGIEVFYNTSWYAPAYMPASGSFYLQDQIKTGNYPFMDVFLNLRIKRARIFLLLQHANSGLTGYRYYMVPTYPMADRAFKFGVNWMFFD